MKLNWRQEGNWKHGECEEGCCHRNASPAFRVKWRQTRHGPWSVTNACGHHARQMWIDWRRMPGSRIIIERLPR